MGTKAAIGLLNKDGTVHSLRLRYDGMPNDAGKTLIENYNTEALIQALFKSGGDLRTLGATPQRCVFYCDSDFKEPTEHANRKSWEEEYEWCNYRYLFNPIKGEWETIGR